MKKNKLLIALAIAACATTALADDEINYSFGLKSWNHKFKQDSVTDNTSGTILSATARKGDYFVTGSALMPTTYTFEAGSNLIRRDTDIAVGYSLNSNVSLLAGQKRIGVRMYEVDTDSTSNSTISISYLGLNGFTSIGEQSFLYGTVTRSFKAKDSSNTESTKFSSYEAGVGYIINKNTQLTAGYRYQRFSDSSTTTLPGIIFGVNITP